MSTRFAALVLAGLMGACGPDDATPEGGPAEVPQDEGLVLDSADFQGIEAENVAFNLHWVMGPVNREAQRLAPPVNEVREITTLEGPTYDRVIFHLGEGGIPGYSLVWTEEPPVDCNTKESVTLAGSEWLKLTLAAATLGEGAQRPQDPRQDNLRALAITCHVENGELSWYFGAQRQAQVRVLEMRSPRRLIVDIRHRPPAGG